jgi:MFS family permease
VLNQLILGQPRLEASPLVQSREPSRSECSFESHYLLSRPLVAKEELGGAWAWGLILAAQSAGLVVGSLVVLHLRPRRPLFLGQAAILLLTPPLALLAVGAPALVIAASVFAAGIGLDVFEILWQTALQENVPNERLSRVSSYDALGSFVFVPIGLAVAGPLATAIGIDATLWLAFGLISAVTVAVLLVPDVRRLPRGGVEQPQPVSA